MLNGFIARRWREVVDGCTGRLKTITWLSQLTVKVYDMCGAAWGKRNELLRKAYGGRLYLAWQQVAEEVAMGPGDNPRVVALMSDGSRPGDNSTMEYINM